MVIEHAEVGFHQSRPEGLLPRREGFPLSEKDISHKNKNMNQGQAFWPARF
jgi:hypothetical protein